MFDIICVLSVPHSGTHSIMNLIDAKGYKKFIENPKYTKLTESDNFNHVYIWGLADSLPPTSEGLRDHYLINKSKINVIHGHIDNLRNINAAKMINEYTRIIVPIRDPLLSLISAEERLATGTTDKMSRKAEKNIFGLTIKTSSSLVRRQLINFVLLVKELDKLDNVYIPIDLNRINDFSYKRINFKDIGKHGSIGNYPLKKAYYNADVDLIKDRLGVNYDTLQEMEPIFRPFLEKIGYKNLLWWS